MTLARLPPTSAALALAGPGRHEEAIRIWDELFEIARELGRSPAVLLNYSSLAYRELLDLDEARRRSEEALELSAGGTFGIPSSFARSDLLFTDLLADEVGNAQAAWPTLWEHVRNTTGWTNWLIYGRLATARAEIALRAESPASAVGWAQRAIEIARRTRPAIAEPELRQDVRDVCLDRRFAQEERRGDLVIRESSRDQPQDLELTLGQLRVLRARTGLPQYRGLSFQDDDRGAERGLALPSGPGRRSPPARVRSHPESRDSARRPEGRRGSA